MQTKKKTTTSTNRVWAASISDTQRIAQRTDCHSMTAVTIRRRRRRVRRRSSLITMNSWWIISSAGFKTKTQTTPASAAIRSAIVFIIITINRHSSSNCLLVKVAMAALFSRPQRLTSIRRSLSQEASDFQHWPQTQVISPICTAILSNSATTSTSKMSTS